MNSSCAKLRICAAILVAVIVVASASAQTILRVDETAQPGGDGQTWATAFNSLVEALALADDGSQHQLWVARGTYTAPMPNFALRVGDELYGGFDGSEAILSERDPSGNLTILDGAGTHRVLTAGSDTVVDGVTIQNGSRPTKGGGMRTAAGPVTVRNVLFLNNTATGDGGGIYCYDGTLILQDCVFRSNSVTQDDGDLADGGGAGTYDGELIIQNCVFEDNSAQGRGGAFYCYTASRVSIEASTFVGNSANNGGAVMCHQGRPVLVGCSFIANSALLSGGACQVGAADFSNCVFSGNHAVVSGGALRGTQENLALSTFVRNSAGAQGACLFTGASIASNCIIARNSLPQINGSPDVTFSLIDTGYPGLGNLSGDPGFRNPIVGDYRLDAGSPCIDAGKDAVLPADALDIDGDGDTDEPIPFDRLGGERIRGAGVDLGAHESMLGCGDIAYFCAALPNSTGAGCEIAFQGSPAFAAQDFRLSATGVPANTTGIFAYGQRAVQIPFGDGLRCIGGLSFRLPPLVTADQDGTALATLPLPSGGPGSIHTGSTWNFQFWYVDAGGPGGSGFNLSDAVRVRFCN